MSDRELRPIEAIREWNKIERNPIPPPPKIAWLALDQLVVDGGYQRSLSNASTTLIRRLVARWDWNCFKPLSVAAVGDGRYEIIDGQHTAIAAATHGAIETLPCLVLDATTLAQRSRAFVGINRDRIALTPFALYRARLAAEDEEAVAVYEALHRAGCGLEESLRYDREYPAGTVACVATLLQIVRRGGGAAARAPVGYLQGRRNLAGARRRAQRPRGDRRRAGRGDRRSADRGAVGAGRRRPGGQSRRAAKDGASQEHQRRLHAGDP